MRDADEAYARLAPVYDRLDNPVAALGLALVDGLGPALAGRDVLDIGCGTGAPARRAARHGPRSWVGVDRVGEMLDRFGGGAAVQADFEALPFAAAAFDLVLAWLALGYAARPGRALAEARRVLRAGGRIRILEMHPEGRRLGWRRVLGGIDTHAVIHSDEAWAEAFEEAGLAILARRAIPIDSRLRAAIERAGMRYAALSGRPLLIEYELAGAEHELAGRHTAEPP